MTISEEAWVAYTQKLGALGEIVKKGIEEFIAGGLDFHTPEGKQALVAIAYALADRYAVAASTLACEMNDAVAEASNVIIPPSVPAPPPTYDDVAKVVNGVLKTTDNPEIISAAVSRQVKLASQDTILQNAARDHSEFAWIPHGDTCPFCLIMASRGWQSNYDNAIEDGHAAHIHSNCDCSYGVRFRSDTKYAGYDPGRYLKMYERAPGRGWHEKLNAMRREAYAENKEAINAQKRSAYEKRKELNAPSAEEINV